MTNLKAQLIRLGNQNPELRGHIKPVIDAVTDRRVVAANQYPEKGDDPLKAAMIRLRNDLGRGISNLVDGWGKGNLNDRHPLMQNLDYPVRIQFSMSYHDTTVALGIGAFRGNIQDPTIACRVLVLKDGKRTSETREIRVAKKDYMLSYIAGFLQDVLVSRGVRVSVF